MRCFLLRDNRNKDMMYLLDLRELNRLVVLNVLLEFLGGTGLCGMKPNKRRKRYLCLCLRQENDDLERQDISGGHSKNTNVRRGCGMKKRGIKDFIFPRLMV